MNLSTATKLNNLTSRVQPFDFGFITHDFSDVHHLTTEGFVKYIAPLLPTSEELKAQEFKFVTLPVFVSQMERAKRSAKLHKPIRIKPEHRTFIKVGCPTDDMFKRVLYENISICPSCGNEYPSSANVVCPFCRS